MIKFFKCIIKYIVDETLKDKKITKEQKELKEHFKCFFKEQLVRRDF